MVELIRANIQEKEPDRSHWLRSIQDWIKRRPLSQREKRWELMKLEVQQSQKQTGPKDVIRSWLTERSY